MSILPADGQKGNQEGAETLPLDRTSIGQWLLRKDNDGVTYASLSFMDGVENWVVQRLGQDPELHDAVLDRLEKLGELIGRYRQCIPADNYAFLQAIAWLNSSTVMYVLDYLSVHQPDFLAQLVEHCARMENDDINADLMLKRLRAVWRARLLDRIYSPENVKFVMSVLMRDSQ